MALTLTSQSFKEGATLGMEHVLSAEYGFGTSGGNKSPQLSWSGAPAGTKSFAVHCFDPDAPTGSGFWHWVVVNIPPDVTELKLDAGNPKSGLLPKGALMTRTDFGAPGYGGPAPPPGHGPHRYQFTVFAVKEASLPVNADTSAAVVGFYLHFNTLERTTLTGTFQRQPVTPSSNRRAFLGAAASLILPLPATRVAHSKSGLDGFEFRDGIGRRAGGPNLPVLADSAGQYPSATARNWWQPPYGVDAFSRLDEIFAASTARRAAAASPWRRATREPDVRFANPASLGGGRYDIDGYLDRQPATGLLIAQGDTILAERYQYGRSDTMRLTSFSMAKTIVALLIGLAVGDRLIASLDDPAERHAPTLAGTEYGRTPLRALLSMSSGVKFREDYDGADDVTKLSAATFGRQSPGGVDAVRYFNERIAAPGARWYYASSETYVLAMVARAVFGRPLTAVLQDRIWQPMGAEADATWLTDRSGVEIGYMGFNAVLRDYARLGLLMANGGRAGGRQLIDPAWVAAMTKPSFSPSQTGRPVGYGFQTWTIPGQKPTFGLFGVRGQLILVEPTRQLVMVHTAVRTDARDAGAAASFALWAALVSA